jgi:hypothetical protein
VKKGTTQKQIKKERNESEIGLHTNEGRNEQANKKLQSSFICDLEH